MHMSQCKQASSAAASGVRAVASQVAQSAHVSMVTCAAHSVCVRQTKTCQLCRIHTTACTVAPTTRTMGKTITRCPATLGKTQTHCHATHTVLESPAMHSHTCLVCKETRRSDAVSHCRAVRIAVMAGHRVC